jgi:hypothetical protein
MAAAKYAADIWKMGKYYFIPLFCKIFAKFSGQADDCCVLWYQRGRNQKPSGGCL